MTCITNVSLHPCNRPFQTVVAELFGKCFKPDSMNSVDPFSPVLLLGDHPADLATVTLILRLYHMLFVLYFSTLKSGKCTCQELK